VGRVPIGDKTEIPAPRQGGEREIAVTKIWDIKGFIGKVVIYIENPNKTENPDYVQSDMSEADLQSMEDVMEYAMRDKRADSLGHVLEYATDGKKTERQYYVSALNCSVETAREDMTITKQTWSKTDGNTAYHGYQAFKPGEVTPDVAHEIGVELARQLWGERFEVVIATHLDKGHIHNHFVLNSVSFKDGGKFRDSQRFWRLMARTSDKLCEQHLLNVLADPQRGKTKHYAEWQAEREGKPTWRGMIREVIDNAIAESMTESQFYANLKSKGYEIKVGKDISVRPPSKERFVRLERNFGADYSAEGIRRQIHSHGRPRFPEPPPKRTVMVVRFHGNLKTTRKLTGFRALYVHYLYLLGKLPKDHPRPPEQVKFLYREDLRKLDNIIAEGKLLWKYRIDTSEQLSSFKGERQAELKSLNTERGKLRNQLRRPKDDSTVAEVKEKISLLSTRIGQARKEVKMCESIEKRTAEMKAKITAERTEQNLNGKEVNRYDKRGRG
jgi:hypothetical protein